MKIVGFFCLRFLVCSLTFNDGVVWKNNLLLLAPEKMACGLLNHIWNVVSCPHCLRRKSFIFSFVRQVSLCRLGWPGTLQTNLISILPRSICLCLSSANIKGMIPQAQWNYRELRLYSLFSVFFLVFSFSFFWYWISLHYPDWHRNPWEFINPPASATSQLAFASWVVGLQMWTIATGFQ